MSNVESGLKFTCKNRGLAQQYFPKHFGGTEGVAHSWERRGRGNAALQLRKLSYFSGETVMIRVTTLESKH